MVLISWVLVKRGVIDLRAVRPQGHWLPLLVQDFRGTDRRNRGCWIQQVYLAGSRLGSGHQGKRLVLWFDDSATFRPVLEFKGLAVDVRLLGKQFLMPGIGVRSRERDAVGVLGPCPGGQA